MIGNFSHIYLASVLCEENNDMLGCSHIFASRKTITSYVFHNLLSNMKDPVLRWNMDNSFIKRDPAGNIKPDKEKSTEKIDGSVATIMALDRAIRCGNDSGDSIYDERELLIL